MPTRDLVYISYRHVDAEWHAELRRVLDSDSDLRSLIWDDTMISPAQEFAREIDNHVARARIMIMLTSEDYFGPDSGALEPEVRPALAAQARGEVAILWIPIRPHDYTRTPVGHITAATEIGRAHV